MSLHCKEVRDLLKELEMVIDFPSLVHEDTPFLSTSPSSVTHKSKTVEELLGEVAGGILSLLHSSEHTRVFGLEQSVPGSREMKGNVPLLHDGIVDLFDMLTSVVHMIEEEE